MILRVQEEELEAVVEEDFLVLNYPLEPLR
jgi:hypothetical protein